jgi:uncharacterized protein (DUF1330 family)
MEIDELKSEMHDELRSLRYDRNIIVLEIDSLEDVIANGNFEGYSEALKHRKERLQSTKESLIAIDKEIEILESKLRCK